MAAVSATMVRDLREKTSAGMLDCKKALEETQGNFEAAIEWLRKKGLASAGKKADRLAAEGLVSAFLAGEKVGVVLEMNSETDFVARNDGFKKLISEVAEHLAKSAKVAGSPEELLSQNLSTRAQPITVELAIKEAIATIGENLVLRRFVRYDAAQGFVHSYIHGEGKIGVLIEMKSATAAPEIRQVANDIALHVAAMNPISLSGADVPAALIEKEKEILKARNLEQGKKAEMVDKIVEGQIKKYIAENCLLEQAFVKNPDQKVRDYLAEVSKKVGSPVDVVRFVRFELGEGLQKRSTDFAAEVEAQAKARH